MVERLRKLKGNEPYKVLAQKLKKCGVVYSEPFISGIFSGKRPVTKRIAEAMGYRRVGTYLHYKYEKI